MADIRLFRALRYDATRVDLQTVVAPPYDVLSEAEARAYRLGSPYNAIHLDMPADEEAAVGEDRYAHVAAEFARWQREGVLLRDGRPALYVLTQDFRGPDGVLRRRRGFIGRLGLGEPGSEVLRPHEATNSGPRRDRLALLRAGHANFSPIFVLYADAQQPVWETLATAERPARLLSFAIAMAPPTSFSRPSVRRRQRQPLCSAGRASSSPTAITAPRQRSPTARNAEHWETGRPTR